MKNYNINIKSIIQHLKTVNIFLFLLGIFLFNSCNNKDSEQNTTEEKTAQDNRIFINKEQWKSNGFELVSAVQKEFPEVVQSTGMIDVPPQNKAVVNTPMGGYVKNTSLLIGDQVRKGKSLLTIENPEFISIQQEFMELSRQLNYLKSEYQRYKTMYDEKITAQKNYLKAESNYKTTSARYQGLKKQLNLLNISTANAANGNFTSVIHIYSPINGSVTKMNVIKGSYVSPSTPILEIVNNDHLHLELTVFERDVVKINKGQTIRFTLPEVENKPYLAEVHLIGTSIDENRTVKIHGHLLDEENHNFITGMFVNAEIITDSKSAKALPETALAELNNVNYALKLDEKTSDGYYFKPLKINVGEENNGFKMVKDSVSNQSQFLKSGVFELVGE